MSCAAILLLVLGAEYSPSDLLKPSQPPYKERKSTTHEQMTTGEILRLLNEMEDAKYRKHMEEMRATQQKKDDQWFQNWYNWFFGK